MKNGEEKKYKESELPRIKLNDPMTLYYNGKVGDVFKIIRENILGQSNGIQTNCWRNHE